ncbi:hypothetical protein BGZ70_005384, partial [Mortierella alpina]
MKIDTVPECEENVSFVLHYFELACLNACSEDHVLWGEGKPDQFIRIGAEGTDFRETPIAIEACDISASGKLAVTVYFSPTSRDESDTAEIFGAARIEVWDLSAQSGQASSDHPQAITTPVASWSVSMPVLRKCLGNSRETKASEDLSPPPRPTVNISGTGLHVSMAVGWARMAVHAAPFLIYRTEQNPPGHYNYVRVPRICQEIQTSFAFGAFHNACQDDPYSEKERYFNIYGSQLDIYSTN